MKGNRREKSLEYEAAGVREYWIIVMQQQRVAVHSRGGDRRAHALAPQAGKIHSLAGPGSGIKPEWRWQGPECDTRARAKKKGIPA